MLEAAELEGDLQPPQVLPGRVHVFHQYVVRATRRDELKASELGRLLRDRTGLKRREIGRIRVRDKHALVDVPEDRAQEVIESMAGAMLRDRELELELAKGE